MQFCNTFLTAKAVQDTEVFEFLQDMIPEKTTVGQVLANQAQQQQQQNQNQNQQ